MCNVILALGLWRLRLRRYHCHRGEDSRRRHCLSRLYDKVGTIDGEALIVFITITFSTPDDTLTYG